MTLPLLMGEGWSEGLSNSLKSRKAMVNVYGEKELIGNVVG